jgi:membrane protein YdbS with pleckstrin-like domain
MELKTTEHSGTVANGPQKTQEKIVFEIKQLLLPTILNYEILTMLGFTLVILIAAVAFRFGPWEFIIIGVLFMLIALPSFMAIFRAGSTTYVLTNQRLIIFSVGIRSRERAIPLEQIQDVKCKPSGLQRLYGAGDLIIYQKALRRPVRLLGIKECQHRAEQIQQAVKKKQPRA